MRTDAKIEVIERLLKLTRLIRKRGTPEEAMEAAQFEMQFEEKLRERRREIASNPELPGIAREEVAA